MRSQYMNGSRAKLVRGGYTGPDRALIKSHQQKIIPSSDPCRQTRSLRPTELHLPATHHLKISSDSQASQRSM